MKINPLDLMKETREARAERIRRTGNAYCEKVKDTGKAYNRKDKGWRDET